MNDVAPSTTLIPVNDCVLVQLEKTSVKEGKYDTRTNGIVINTPAGGFSDKYIEDVANLFNKRVYFEEYKEGARIKKNGELFCFIKIEDIRGYEDV
jgi:co-chaperonin GroES (HSP10)